MIGAGTYQWRDLDGKLREADHWGALPERMLTLIRFEPDVPPEPHTEKEHAIIETFAARLREALNRCQR